MLLNQHTLFIALQFFIPWELTHLMFSHALLEIPVQSCNLTMTSHNFQHILSWKSNSIATTPIYYTVWYKIWSTVEEWKAVEDCTNITTLSCEITDFYEIRECYFINVTGFSGEEKLVECVLNFFPISETILDPPEISIFNFKDAVNVTVHHPTFLSKLKEIEKDFFSSVVIKVESNGSSSQDLKVEMADKENVTVTTDPLIPNSNYCISAQWKLVPSDKIQSSSKCFTFSPSQESEKSTLIPVVFVVCFIIILLITTFVKTLKNTGYICRKPIPSPKALDFPPVTPGPLRLHYEKITVVEIIYKIKKKEMLRESDDKSDNEDKSDSDYESTQRTGNGYIMNCLTSRSLSQDSTFTQKEGNPTGSGPKDPECPETNPPLADAGSATSNQLKAGPDEKGVSRLWSFISEGSVLSSESEDCSNFNVNLNTVFVGDPGDNNASEEDDAQILLPVQEDKTNLVDSDGSELLSQAACGKTPLLHVPSAEHLWSENSSSDESATSESDKDQRGGYLRR
ncbi:interferon alpha/beta receptor 2 isoform X1 [Monodelphis domestica]|uniref:interferon alpha/beta receptor 2 isoform X1 n=1 Tax=Monodelphis domestica TaxID=13616 RepID=UPI0024E1FD63|nr:interferon alpha/beta receptor 2 isoform X1 [Monodelphis domestica]